MNGTAGLRECEQFMLIIPFRLDELAIVMNGQNDEARSLFRTRLCVLAEFGLQLADGVLVKRLSIRAARSLCELPFVL